VRRFALLFALVACEGAPSGPAPTRVVPPPPDPEVVEAKPPAAAQEVDAPPIRKDGTIYAESELMGTRFSINLWVGADGDASAGGEAIHAAIAEVDRIEGLASEWIAQSELSRFSDGAGGPMMELSPDLFALLRRSRELAEASDGAFDPTFYAIGDLWKFEPGSRPPAPEEIEARLALIGWERIELDPESRRGRLQTPGMKVGLGAIAKGYAVDRAAKLLRDRGFADHIVEGGGDTYVSGSKGGQAWVVGIQRPDGPGTVGALPLRDRALVTSGGYQRFFEFDGKRYAHIIDPRTGWPLDEAESALSVSVVAADATDADAYCTAVAVMGPTRGMAFVEATPAVEAVIIDHSGEVRVSTGLREIFVTAPAGK
jgi:thiamine biosynthesis lipoprotein